MTQTQNKSAYRSGFVTIIGSPNVGKSTLMNALLKEKVAIMSDKPNKSALFPTERKQRATG